MRNRPTLIALSFLLLLTCAIAAAAQDKYGKYFVKGATTEVDGQQIPDDQVEQGAKEVRKAIRAIYLADKESDADFLIVVNERKSTAQSGNPAAKSLVVTLYIRKNGDWKPATKLTSGSNDIFWDLAAEKIVKKASAWIAENGGLDTIPSKPSSDLTPFVGKYISQKNKSDYFELKADSTIFLQQKGKSYNGRYDIKDSVITFALAGVTSKGDIAGSTITDSGKSLWIRQ